MAFETVFDASQGTIVKFENKNDAIEGYYMGSFDYTGDYGPTKRHVFQTERGAEIVFGQKHLMQVLPSIKPGTMVRITYTDDLPAKTKGRAAMKLFKFEQDKKNTIDVGAVDFAQTDTADADLDSQVDDADLTPVDDVAPARATKPATPAAAPSAARQAATQRLLNGRRNPAA